MKKHYALLAASTIFFLAGCMGCAAVTPPAANLSMTATPQQSEAQSPQPTHTPQLPQSPQSPQPTQSSQPGVLPTDLAGIDNALVYKLDYQEYLGSRPNILGSATLPDGTTLFCSYEEDDDISHLFINHSEVLRYPWEWTVMTGEYDLTGDGVKELILLVSPRTANSGAGNLHVYDLSAGDFSYREILSFWGERYYEDIMKVPFNDYDTSIELPDDFPYTGDSHKYNTKLIGVDVLELDGIFFLRLMNDADQQEIAYTYVSWDGEWKVLGQQLIPA